MKFDRAFGYAVVVATFTAAIAVLIPWNARTWTEARTVKIFTYGHPRWTDETARKEASSRIVQLVNMTGNIDIATVHRNLIFVNEIIGNASIGAAQEPVRRLAKMNMDAYLSHPEYRRMMWELDSLQKSDPAWRTLREPTETTWHWNVLREHAGKMFPFCLAFCLVGLAGLMKLWGLAKLVYVCGCTISFLLSVAGGAVAQTVKKAASDKQKDKAGQTLQIDARVSLYTSEGPPNPGLFVRVTNSRRKGLVETVSTFNPRNRSWSSDIVAGLWVPGTGKTKVLADVLWTDASGAGARIGAGVQIFRSGRFGFFALPVLRWERKVHGPPIHSFAIGPNPNIKIGSTRWSIAPDVGARRTQGKPWTWYAGVGIRYTPDKGKTQVELGGLTNNAGWTFVRPRFIRTMAY
ncbi:MAG: hypothetical protein A2657_01860 [Candidatus Yanofskybacteria bacterium RIFCSPHIGHO2_01_FULL_44_110b]|uniref:Uncharacterized protein n=1 Tax=Candidatus Yanofskybacteria bacterium RIFCSPLOWO2_02_FULL_44_18 TaxID=1802705 RepID=A0A1F8H1K9_9BACT|nr:MAG: hypothetical protein A2657_01860 [Candidatus Yanofskybacteria bacterium RIFCSPHIGHO2_01_FULL_44_110b]OGN26477.1 MAG: hypothetical protein A3B12_03030 [Candidatus Yanofskybacteria bacterium RIFCSPLOWO2_01_FULL_44_88]OGN31421.1 MAG: hypothetical protein A3I96_01135 [Candidatus Yanofskybacteria bacterium RIFCSPLOWO2_02_FULL_44_18]